MSKLSQPLKALINATHFKPSTTPAPQTIAALYESIARDATSKGVGLPAWLCASTAATMTLNSPESLLQLHQVAASALRSPKTTDASIYTAELMREVGLKCIGFNGIPRTINCLNAFRDGLPSQTQEALQRRQPRRKLAPINIDDTLRRGHSLWDSIYQPVTEKLTRKLASAHPDLPVYIIESGYGALFSDPISSSSTPNVGRVLTSIVAIACLRAQTGVGPQVVSHVFGLRKAFDDGSAEQEEQVDGAKWLASDEGSIWLLQCTDQIVEVLSGQHRTTFATGYKAKL